MRGTISKITDNGYGFIRTAQGEDVFVHTTSLPKGVALASLFEGDEVEFDVIEGREGKGPRAVNCRLI